MKTPASRSGNYGFASRLTNDPWEAVAFMRDVDTENRLTEVRENRRGKGLPIEPTDEQIMQIWFSLEHAKASRTVS
jgi:hypothetical protein